ncbi:MAG: ABC transporter permease [Sedimenticolaceae bacterium]
MRFSASILGIWLLMALVGALPWLQPHLVSLPEILMPPSPAHWLGTDELGRPVLDRLLAGASVSLLVALTTVTLSAAIGITVGLVAGWFGGPVDRVISRLIEVFLAFPGMLLAIAMAAMIGPGIDNVIIALALMGWVGYARLVRVQVLSLRQRDHVLAAAALGRTNLAIMTRHLLPLVMAPVWVEASFGLAGAVVAEAGLSFLGLGIQPPDASWGGMIRDGVRYLLVAPHLVLAPGVGLFLVVLAANLFGDALRDRFDVTSRSTP